MTSLVCCVECVIQTSARNVFNVLYPGDETPEWNPQCGLNQVCTYVHSCVHVRRYICVHTCVCACVRASLIVCKCNDWSCVME